MKKNIIISILLLSVSPLLYSMKEDEYTSEEDTPKLLYPIKANTQGLSFFCSFEEEIKTDDTTLNMYIKMPLFIELCMQALECTQFSQEPLQELLQRFKEGRIIKKEVSQESYAVMTRKDGRYRLMSYIQELQGYPTKCIVNGKEMRLECVLFETEEDKIKTQKMYDRIEALDRGGQERPQGRCCVGCHSGSTISMGWDKSIDNNKEHHEKIVNEFEKLLHK